MVVLRLAVVFVALSVVPAAASEHADRAIESRLLHLRSGSAREWSSFPEKAQGQRLELVFDAAQSVAESTLRLRQQDVKQPWLVTLNGKKLGELVRDENDLVLYLAIPGGALVDGDNRLVIEASPPRSPAESDDIRVGQIEFIPRPRAEILSDASVELQVYDAAHGRDLPCRVTIVDDNGSLHTTSAASTNHQAVRPGVVYTGTGRARFGLPAGKYTIYAGRGFEWSVEQVEVALQPGDVSRQVLSLRREVPTEGYVACDTHVHTLTYSGHGDAILAERMITLAGEGIELPIATDHNAHVDYRSAAEQAGVARYFTPVTGNEVTTSVGHFNVFPVEPRDRPADHTGKDWPSVFTAINRGTEPGVIILNHARDLHSGFRPFGPEHFDAIAGEQLDGWRIGFNAMEVVNSGAVQTDPLQLFHDWMALLNHGHDVTPIGSSDSHDVSRFIVGQGRTYVRVDEQDPGQIRVDAAMAALRDGRVMVSYGLLAELTVNDRCRSGDLCPVSGDQLEVDVRVLGPNWIKADRIRLYSNGVLIRDAAIPKPLENAQLGVKWQTHWELPAPKHDVHLVAIATGPGIEQPFWPMAKPYQPTSPEWLGQAIGCSGALWIDGDHDGQRTCARRYAERCRANAGQDVSELVAELAAFDQATAAQAATLLLASNDSKILERLEAAMLSAPFKVRAGFRSAVRAWREARAARLERSAKP